MAVAYGAQIQSRKMMLLYKKILTTRRSRQVKIFASFQVNLRFQSSSPVVCSLGVALGFRPWR